MSDNTQEKVYNELPEWVTTSQAGEMLGRTGRRVLQLIEDGELEAKQINPRLWMVKRESVEAYKVGMQQ